MTWGEALVKIQKGERFEDPEILMRGSRGRREEPYVGENGIVVYPGTSIAHIQARRGWTTLDPDILSLEGIYDATVLDVMLAQGWEPQTEEEKLIVFTVKAGT